MRRLWHWQNRPKLFGYNSWEIRWCGNDEEESPPPQQPAVKTADQLFNESIEFAKRNTPLAYGAKESALRDLAKGNEYYAGFQPTSFEEALATGNFNTIMPDIERSIKQNLSLSGMAYSPILAELIGRERGKLGVSIGDLLTQYGNQRAGYSLSSRLGIDPYSTYQPYLATNTNQSNLNNEIAYQNALNSYNREQGKNVGMATGIGSVIGGGIGLFGGPVMGALGAGLGGGIGSLFENPTSSSNPYVSTGATKAPISISDALLYSTMMGNGKAQPVYGNDGYGSNSFDIQLRNLLAGKGMPQQIGSYSGYYS